MVGLQISSAIVIAMTSRTYHVCPDGKKFRIQVRTMYEKASKRVLYERRGYPCSNSANNDVTRLIKFFRDGNGKITYFKSCYTNVSNCRNLAVKADYARTIEGQKGIVKSRNRSSILKEYNTYQKIMISWKEEYSSLKDWTLQQNQDSFNKDRFMRRYYRDPKVIQATITKGLLSNDDSDVIESYKTSIDYLGGRLKTIHQQTLENLSNLKVLRQAIFSGNTHTLVLKAKFDDEKENEEVLDLTEDDKFTAGNISKSQLTRSIQQCQLIEKLYHHISLKLADEKSLVTEVLTTLTDPKLSIHASKVIIQQHWNRIKEYKLTHSIGQNRWNCVNEGYIEMVQ